jgi:hypothetical protein
MMRCAKRGIIASCLVAAVLWVSGCKHEPNPPTEQDAIAVWKNIHRRAGQSELISLKKTNGQVEIVNGVRVYTLYYTATDRAIKEVGIHHPGWINTNQSNYPFQWTEKGWQGPDGQVYPEH